MPAKSLIGNALRHSNPARSLAGNWMRRMMGMAATPTGLLATSAQEERAISQRPVFTQHRAALQGADGAFNFKPGDDGALTAGHFGIDAFGRFVTV